MFNIAISFFYCDNIKDNEADEEMLEDNSFIQDIKKDLAELSQVIFYYFLDA